MRAGRSKARRDKMIAELLLLAAVLNRSAGLSMSRSRYNGGLAIFPLGSPVDAVPQGDRQLDAEAGNVPFCAAVRETCRVGEIVSMVRRGEIPESSIDGFHCLDSIFVVDGDDTLVGEISSVDLLRNAEETAVGDICRPSEVVVLEDDIGGEGGPAAPAGGHGATGSAHGSPGLLGALNLQRFRRNRGASRRVGLELSRAGVLTAPVVDGDGRLVRVVSPMEVLAAVERSLGDDSLRRSGMFLEAGAAGARAPEAAAGEGDGEEEDVQRYFDTPVWKLVIARSGWLIGLLLVQSLSGVILKHYEDLLSAQITLALFLTMLTGTAGNAGNQSTSLVIRGLATNEIRQKNVSQVLLRELKVGAAMSLLLGIAAFCRVMLTPGATLPQAVVISASLFVTVTLGVLVGAAAPIVLRRVGIDPANCASPALATLMDITGVLIMCLLARCVLQA